MDPRIKKIMEFYKQLEEGKNDKEFKIFEENIKNWQNSDIDTPFVAKDGKYPKGILNGTTPFHPIMKNPLDLNVNKTVLYYDDKCVVFLPANPKKMIGFTTPYGENTASYNRIGGDESKTKLTEPWMSNVHILVIPRQNIYNAVSLNKEHIPLIKHMENVGSKLAELMLVGDNFLKYNTDSKDINYNNEYHNYNSKEYGLKPIMSVDLKDHPLRKNWDEVNKLNINNFKDYIPHGLNLSPQAAKKILGDNNRNIKKSFHIYPNQSVGQLHLHCYLESLMTHSGKNNDYKNVPSVIVRHWLLKDIKKEEECKIL